MAGGPLAASIRATQSARVEVLRAVGVTPRLAVFLVGDDAQGHAYVRQKQREAAHWGCEVEVRASVGISESSLIQQIAATGDEPSVHGVLVVLPLPAGFDRIAVADAIPVTKDVDGMSPHSRGLLLSGYRSRGFVPGVVAACMAVLNSLDVKLAGTRVTLVGGGETVGKPLGALLMSEQATVTVCNRYTKHLEDECRRAEVLISAVGQPELIRGDMVAPGAVVLDCGAGRVLGTGAVVGDVATAEVALVARAVTPVPRGIGVVSAAMVIANLIAAAARIHGIALPSPQTLSPAPSEGAREPR